MYEEQRRAELVEILRASGIKDKRVLAVIGRIPRHLFVLPEDYYRAYEDRPLQIGFGQTISQPHIIAYMTESLALTGTQRVLEIGTGSGYQTAILAELASEVYTIERIPELSTTASKRLSSLGYKNIHYKIGDGTLGWEEHSPFDAIMVTAAAPDTPITLLKQLAEGGRMVIPVGGESEQELWLMMKTKEGIKRIYLCSCIFVKLIGKEGWDIRE
jgi:protein-L-isoaspartate(D-aspartate) O-methyltransferase